MLAQNACLPAAVEAIWVLWPLASIDDINSTVSLILSIGPPYLIAVSWPLEKNLAPMSLQLQFLAMNLAPSWQTPFQWQELFKIRVCKASPFGPDSGVKNSGYNVKTIIRIRPKPVLVLQAKELRGASGVKLSAAIFENSKHWRVVTEGSSMGFGVIGMEDSSWLSKLRSMPMIMCGENKRNWLRTYTKDEGFNGFISGKWFQKIREK